MSNAANAALADPWKELWNGDLGLADQIIAEDFVAHAAPLTGSGPDQIRGRDALRQWIGGIHSVLPDLAFVIEVGPITDDEHLVVRWKAHGRYAGGFPARQPRRQAGRSPSPAPTPCASPTASSPSTGPTPTACSSSSNSASARSPPLGDPGLRPYDQPA